MIKSDKVVFLERTVSYQHWISLAADITDEQTNKPRDEKTRIRLLKCCIWLMGCQLHRSCCRLYLFLYTMAPYYHICLLGVDNPSDKGPDSRWRFPAYKMFASCSLQTSVISAAVVEWKKIPFHLPSLPEDYSSWAHFSNLKATADSNDVCVYS